VLLLDLMCSCWIPYRFRVLLSSLLWVLCRVLSSSFKVFAREPTSAVRSRFFLVRCIVRRSVIIFLSFCAAVSTEDRATVSIPLDLSLCTRSSLRARAGSTPFVSCRLCFVSGFSIFAARDAVPRWGRRQSWIREQLMFLGPHLLFARGSSIQAQVSLISPPVWPWPLF
jgi:hypothetical protein